MINGILESKINVITFLIVGLLLCSGCKDQAKTKVSAPTVKADTNIRFATKKDGHKEKTSYDRLTTDKSEITSTIIQMEGPAWENENVAFRNYFDARNGMDIFGKRTGQMILDSVGIDENYHELQDWGMDILKVGNSLGAGGIGLIIRDSIYRMGVGAQGSFKIIKESPQSSSLEFKFENWKIQDRTYSVTHTINIKSGTHYYEGNIVIEGMQGDETLVSGIVDHGVGSTVLMTEKSTIISTHGTQEVEGKILGMAIAVDNGEFKKEDEASNYTGAVDNTHLVLFKGNNVRYKFFAGWELQDEDFRSKDLFEKMVLEEI